MFEVHAGRLVLCGGVRCKRVLGSVAFLVSGCRDRFCGGRSLEKLLFSYVGRLLRLSMDRNFRKGL